WSSLASTYPTLFRSKVTLAPLAAPLVQLRDQRVNLEDALGATVDALRHQATAQPVERTRRPMWLGFAVTLIWSALKTHRSEEHTSELQSRFDLVCRL